MNELEEILTRILRFRDDRDWKQFHNPKDLSIALSVEASELLELFQWKNAEEADKGKVKEELADVLIFSFLLADKYGFDIKEIMFEKLEINAEKYPIAKAKGNAKKYDEY
jgi:NTP pyrophosphatase (non-canonical NTP hydrolase)